MTGWLDQWIKLKSEYLEAGADTHDLLILGGYFGEGRRRLLFRCAFALVIRIRADVIDQSRRYFNLLVGRTAQGRRCKKRKYALFLIHILLVVYQPVGAGQDFRPTEYVFP